MQEEKGKGETISIRFESGTTKEEMLQYVESLKQRFAGKMSEGQLNAFIAQLTQSMENTVTMCDGCRNVISKEEQQLLQKYTFMCRLCSTKYDLCSACQKTKATANCPFGFGCSENSLGKEAAVDVFIEKSNREPVQSYQVFGQTFFVPTEKMYDLETQSLVNDINASSIKLSSIAYIPISPDRRLSNDFLRDMWLFFRSTNRKALQKYGPPTKRINDLGQESVYELYENFRELFEKFIEIEEMIEPTSSLFFRITYDNQDEFIIKRLSPPEKEKYKLTFIVIFIPVSKYVDPNDATSFVDAIDDKTKAKMETGSKMSIQQMRKTGQLFAITISTNSEKV